MQIEKTRSDDAVSCVVERKAETSSRARAAGVFRMECFDKDGNHKWMEEFPNLVVNEGLKDMNDKYFSGSGYTAAWYL